MAQSKMKELAGFVGARASGLVRGVGEGASAAKASLSQLRRATGHGDGMDPLVWAEILPGFPERLIGRGDEPSRYETAARVALSLFAVHQQSKSDSMHIPGVGLGVAVRRLARLDEADVQSQAVMRRFTRVVTAHSAEGMEHFLRGIVQQLRAEGIGLDYGQLAVDLALLTIPEAADGVRLRWMRQLHTRATRNTDAEPADAASA